MGLRAWIKRKALKTALKKLLEQSHIKELKNVAFFKSIFKSKKAGFAVAGILTVLLKSVADLDDATVDMVVKLVMSYLFAQGAVDTAIAFKVKQ